MNGYKTKKLDHPSFTAECPARPSIAVITSPSRPMGDRPNHQLEARNQPAYQIKSILHVSAPDSPNLAPHPMRSIKSYEQTDRQNKNYAAYGAEEKRSDTASYLRTLRIKHRRIRSHDRANRLHHIVKLYRDQLVQCLHLKLQCRIFHGKYGSVNQYSALFVTL